MISLSKVEFIVISFLVRNFSRRYTIRNIASNLGISAAGAHAALKKLESSGVVKVERLGTGLFYDINLENKVAKHLAAIVLLGEGAVEGLENEASAAIVEGKKILAITNNADNVKDICQSYSEVVCKSEEEFIEMLRNKDTSMLEKGNVLFGEDIIVEAIRKVMR